MHGSFTIFLHALCVIPDEVVIECSESQSLSDVRSCVSGYSCSALRPLIPAHRMHEAS